MGSHTSERKPHTSLKKVAGRIRGIALARAGVIALLLSAGLVPAGVSTASAAPTVQPETAPDCAALPGEAAQTRLGSVFVRPDAGPTQYSDWWWGSTAGVTEWPDTVNLLAKACVDSVIVQDTAQTWTGTNQIPGMGAEQQGPCIVKDTKGRWVQPLFSSTDSEWDASRVRYNSAVSGPVSCVNAPERRADQVGAILAAAKARTDSSGRPFKVWLGLQLDENAWFGGGSSNDAWMAQQTALSKDLVDALWAKYGPSNAAGSVPGHTDYSSMIAGFYLPFEANNTEYTTSTAADQAARKKRFDLLNAYTDTVSTYITSKQSSLGVMVAPYHSGKIGADPASAAEKDRRADYQSVVTELLKNSAVSVYAPQDMLGAQGASPTDIAPWFIAARAGISASGKPTKLWATSETYSMQGASNMPIGELTAHMKAANTVISGLSPSVAGIDGYAGFSLNNLNRNAWAFNASLNTLSYRAYLSYLALGWSPPQVVPAMNADRPAEGNTVSAVRLGGSNNYNVQVEFPFLPTAVPDFGGTMYSPVAGYQIYRNGQAVRQLPQPLKQKTTPATVVDGNSDGYPDVDTTARAGTSTGATGVLGFTDPNLQPGNTYTYQVAAFDAFGNTGPKSPGTAVVFPTDAISVVNDTGNPDSPQDKGTDIGINAPYTFFPSSVDASKGSDGSGAWLDYNQYISPNTSSTGGSYPDGVAGPKLSDGNTGEPTFKDPAWTGISNAGGTYTITYNLGTDTQIHTVNTHWLNDPAGGISPPAGISAEWAPDPAGTGGTAVYHSFASGAVDPGTGTNTAGATPVTGIPAGTAGWFSTSLPAGQTANARIIRLTVTPGTAGDWSMISEVEALTASGVAVEPCTRSSTYTCIALARGGSPLKVRYQEQPWESTDPIKTGRLTDPTVPAHPADPWTTNPVGWDTTVPGWCKPDAGTTCGQGSSATITAVVDLGTNQPIGSLSSSWYNLPGYGVLPPTAVTMAYRHEQDQVGADTGFQAATQAATDSGAGKYTTFNATVPVPATVIP